MTVASAPSLAICVTAFEYGGQGRVIEEEIRHLADHYRVSLLTSRCARKVPDGAEPVVVRAHGGTPGLALRLARQLEAYDLIHCHDSTAFMAGAALTGRPWVVTSHGICPPRYRNSLRSAAEGAMTQIAYPPLYRRAHRVVAISSFLQEWLRRRGVGAVLIPNGAPPPRTGASVRPTGRDLLYVGELSRRKGVFELIEMLATLPSDVRIRFVGRGAVSELKRRASEAGVADRIDITVEASEDRLAGLYAESFAVCSASYWEGFGLPIVEGFSFGRPAIVRDVAGMRELVAASGGGVRFVTQAQLEAGLERVTAEWERLSEAGSAYAAANPWSSTFDRYARLFQEVLAE